MRRNQMTLLIGLSISLYAAAAVQAAPAPTPRDIDQALRYLMNGSTSPDELHIEIIKDNYKSRLVVHGNGICILDNEKEVRLSRDEIKAILKALQDAKFSKMPGTYGGGEPTGMLYMGQPTEAVEITRAVWLIACDFEKHVDQFHRGEQSKELKTLVDTITEICERHADKSASAKDLDDGLRKIAKDELAPETLDVYLSCCPKGAFDADDNWWIRVKGRTISAYKGTLANARETRLQLSPKEFQEVFDMVTHTYKELPARLHSVPHLHFTVAVFKHEKDVKAWKFDGITPLTHGDKQKEFDHLVEQIEKLHQRAMKEGRPLKWVDDPK